MRRVYNLCFFLVFAACSPWLWFKLRRRGPWQQGLGQRFGRYGIGEIPPRKTGVRRLWLHAVSVGEVNTALQLVTALSQRFPQLELVASTTTNTGMAELQRKLPSSVIRIYFPLDFARWVRCALDTVQPDAVVLMEREIWPNFLWEATSRNLPVLLVNARMTGKSLRRAQRGAFLFRALYGGFEAVGAQSPEDAQRLEAAGCRRETLHITGSMKFDTAPRKAPTEPDVAELLNLAGRKPMAPVLVAGSTHEGEELLLAEICRRLRASFPDLFLVLVPRHCERCPKLSRLLDSRGFKHQLRSALPVRATPPASHCLLVDSTGELVSFYAEADVVFVGKSLSARGGQNPIEPAALGRAVAFGPNMQNFPDASRLLVAAQGAVMVQDAAGLEAALRDLFGNPDKGRALGRRAMEVVRANCGATERSLDLIAGTLGWQPAAPAAQSHEKGDACTG